MNKEDEKIQLISDYQWFKTPSGQNVLKHMKKLASYNASTAPPVGNDGQTDPYRVMHERGQRTVITTIEMWMNKDPNEKKGIKNGKDYNSNAGIV